MANLQYNPMHTFLEVSPIKYSGTYFWRNLHEMKHEMVEKVNGRKRVMKGEGIVLEYLFWSMPLNPNPGSLLSPLFDLSEMSTVPMELICIWQGEIAQLILKTVHLEAFFSSPSVNQGILKICITLLNLCSSLCLLLSLRKKDLKDQPM